MTPNHLLPVLILVVLLAACRDPGPDGAEGSSAAPSTAPAASPAAPAAVPEPAEVPSIRALDRPLPGGVAELPFALHVSVDREAKRPDGTIARTVGIELLGSGHEEADASLRTRVLDAGGVVEERSTSGVSVRTVYRLADGSAMLVWARPGAPGGERYAIQRPEATGTLYLAWPYVPSAD